MKCSFRYGSRAGAVLLVGLAGLLIASCASPALKLYVLSPAGETLGMSAATTPVIEVTRIRVPDYLDTSDIVVRQGSTLQRSHLGRLASRLSLGATDLVTERLAQRRPDALVTDQPMSGAPAYRLIINIAKIDVSASGEGVLEANWLVIPKDSAAAGLAGRVRFQAVGSASTDDGVVALEQILLAKLADGIDLGALR